MRARRLSGAFLLALAGSADAAVAAHAQVDALSWSSIFSVLSGLVVVIAMLLGAAWLLRRLQRVQGATTAGAIQVVDQLTLGMKDRLLLVRVGDQQVLIGVSTGQLRALHAWQGAEPVAPATTAPMSAAPFMDQLKAVLAASGRRPA